MNDGGDHLMKSLDELIAEDKTSKWKKPYNKPQGKQQNFFKKGIQKNKGYQEDRRQPRNDFNNRDRDNNSSWVSSNKKKPFVKPQQSKGFGGQSQIKGLAQGGTKIRVNNLHYEITQEKLEEIFSEYGRLHNCEIVWDKQDRSTGEAFVVFEHPSAATEAIEKRHKTQLEGQTISVQKWH